MTCGQNVLSRRHLRVRKMRKPRADGTRGRAEKARAVERRAQRQHRAALLAQR